MGNLPLLVKKVFMGNWWLFINSDKILLNWFLICPGGAAEKSGKIKAGDEVIAINGISTEKQSRVEVWNKMKELPQGTVIISLK